MAIGEILLSAFLQVLLEKLASLGLDYAQRNGAPPFSRISIDLLDKWKKMLDTINAVLDDAEDKELSGKGPVKQWLEDVRDLAYDMEDLLDEFAIAAAQAESEAESSTSRGLVKWKFSFIGQHKSSISDPNPRSLVSETEIQKINDRLEEIITKKAHLSLIENTVDRSDYTYKRLPSTSLPEPRFFGREKEEAEILELLTGEAENGDTALSIVPIVGMGGVGKTALAQRLYNDATVSSYFERRAWVCVSDVFHVLDITKTILRSITGLSNEGEDLNGLQVKLKDNLSGKKFLVVLDDVWNENYGEWTDLLKPFEAGAKGSKILVTTRNRTVVSITGALSYPLKELSLDNCTSLLAFHALRAMNFERHPDHETIGKKIAEKCKGSPLAAKVLGGLLRDKGNPDQWEAILNNKMWDLPSGENDEILRVLKLSYVHLPSNLKRCFAYCAVFPKDYEIEKDELILLWIAEGFLDGQREKENILKLGQTHFDELVSRSFLQQSTIDTSKFLMHDLLNDLAKSIAGGTCFSSGEYRVAGDEDDGSLEKARYASFTSSWCVTSKGLRAYHRMKVLRSLMLLHDRSSWADKFHISNKVLHDLLTKLNYLRVFSLCHCSITEVSNCVGDLKHLRYLNFSYTNIERLPESIGGLRKLQALILRGCEKLSMLPLGITKLASLQFLDIRDTRSLQEMPLGVSNLKNLTILSKFVVRQEKGSRLKELKNWPHLQGELFISELQKVEEVRDAVDANIIGKLCLNNLILHWSENFGILRNEKREKLVLHSLRPHANLENLTILYFGGAIFPSWLDGPYLKIVSLCLRGCPNVTSLPSLGQLPLLRELSLESLPAVRMIGSEVYGSKKPFSSLTTLQFEDMLSWKVWSHYAGGPEEEVPFSSLQHLVVRSCPSLIGTLPCQLDRLIKLEIHSCPHLNNSTNVVCLPSLCELYLVDCNKEILKSLVSLTSLTILKVQNLAKLVCFDHEFMSCLIKLKELHIERCDELTYLWRDGNATQSLTCLQRVVIESCPQFTSFVARVEEIELLGNLEIMRLVDCASLERLPTQNALKVLQIINCPKISRITISSGDPNSNNSMSLLKTLYFFRCMNLGSLPECFHRFSHLTVLDIRFCPALEIEDFPPLPISLSNFELLDCPKIKSLPNQWHHLTSLETIDISDCPNINCLPKGGWPPNLRVLKVTGCENLKQPMREWGLSLLTSLGFLSIDGISMGEEGEMVWFPSEEDDEDAWSLLFPSSIAGLDLSHMRNVERLSSGLRNHLSSLTQLWIQDCPKLRYLPDDGLPPSLRQLSIMGCKILEDRCSKLTGDYWPLIQEIPLIHIDDVEIK